MNFLAILLRLLCAVFCGGLIGIERTYKRRPAGFRTHILICLGAAMTTLTSQYLLLVMHYYTDVARLGAQVVAGIGFIGAGSIVVTRRERVKGLTTAAGLWVSAIIGLVCGAGYLECALVAAAMVLLAELLLVRLEYWLADSAKDVNLYIEYAHSDLIERIIIVMKEFRIRVTDLEITRVADPEGHHYCALLALRCEKGKLNPELLEALSHIEGVSSAEEL